jgi:hypothetical protein
LEQLILLQHQWLLQHQSQCQVSVRQLQHLALVLRQQVRLRQHQQRAAPANLCQCNLINQNYKEL